MAVLVIFVTLAVAVGALTLAVTSLGVNTEPADLLSPDLPFRQARAEYQQAFPQNIRTLVLVVDADSATAAREASRRLAEAMGERDDLFEDVHALGAETFFERNGLLYLDVDELDALADRLAAAQPLLARLGASPTADGLARTLTEALESDRELAGEALPRVMLEVAEVLEAQDRRVPMQLDWIELLQPEDADAAARETMLVIARPTSDYERVLAAGVPIAEARRIARSVAETMPGVRVRLTGDAALSHDELSAVLRGMWIIGPLAFLAVTIVLMIALRSGVLVLATLVTMVAGLMMTAGFAALAIGRLNMISIAFAALYVGLGVDFAIHMCMRYIGEVRDGRTRNAAIGQALRRSRGSLTLCAITTAVGFYAFIPTSYRGVSELGIIAGTGMFFSLFCTLFLLPAILRLTPTPKRLHFRTSMWWDWFEALPVRRPRGVVAVGMVVGLASAIALPFVHFNADPLDLRPPGSEPVMTLRDLRVSAFSGDWRITLLTEDAEEAEEASRRLTALPTVRHAVSIDDFVPERQDAKLATIDDLSFILGPSLGVVEDPPTRLLEDRVEAWIDLAEAAVETRGRAPEGSTMAEAALRLNQDTRGLISRFESATEEKALALAAELDRRLMGGFPDAIDRLLTSLQARPIDVEDLPAALRERWVSDDGRHRVDVLPAASLADRHVLREFAESVTAEYPRATGGPVLHVATGDEIVGAFRQALLVAVAGIFLIVLVYLRKPLSAAAVLAPLVLGGMTTVAVMVVVGMPFNFANMIALPLLMGIAVDNGIHLVHRSRKHMPDHGNLLGTLTARAILFSTLTTLCSFGNLAFSPHPGTASMGLLLVIGLIAMLAFTLLLLPAVLRLAHRIPPAEDHVPAPTAPPLTGG